MRITSLRIDDFKRVHHAEIGDCDRAIVVVGGKNGAGKSSALDAIQAALLGGRAFPDEPIRRGAEGGQVEVVLDGMTVRRTFTRKEDGTTGGTLKITTADGMKPASPQAWLDAKIGDLSCDPLAFLAAKPESQADRLRKIAGVDTSALDERRRKAYDGRTDIGRDERRETGALEKMPHHHDAPAEMVVAATVSPEPVPDPVPTEVRLLSGSAIVAELDAAIATEQNASDAAAATLSAAERAESTARAWKDAKERLEALEDRVSAARAALHSQAHR